MHARPEVNHCLARRLAAALLVALVAASPPALGASGTDKSWPCVQRKVPVISAGMMWSGPAVDEADRAWQTSRTIAPLVNEAAARRVALDDAKTAIATFADGLSGDKNRQLTSLFAGLLQRINAERRDIISGIERYAKRQAALAEKIKTQSGKLNTLRSAQDTSDDRQKQIDELEKQLAWDTRVFDEREQSLIYVCEVPVLLEQRLFALARKIMEFLE
ncbi:MAG: hypothetical protein ACR2PO_16015 [Methyloligellaceae bacterium]